MIIRNAIRCNICGDEIESKHRHDFVTCKCGDCSVDGGHATSAAASRRKGAIPTSLFVFLISSMTKNKVYRGSATVWYSPVYLVTGNRQHSRPATFFLTSSLAST